MPSTELKQIPKIAVSAAMLAQQDYQQLMDNLATQTVEAMGLSGGGWHVDFAAGIAHRTLPDEPAAGEQVEQIANPSADVAP